MAITLSPAALGRRFRVNVPPEFQVLAVLFVFAALFLGEMQSYYERIELHMRPRFVALSLFAFLFAVATGTLWEIFEFAMDQIVGGNMQKPTLMTIRADRHHVGCCRQHAGRRGRQCPRWVVHDPP